MAGQMQDDEDAITGINVTPLVDVMLVLLIIFMVTTTYIVNHSIRVKLPKADTGENHAVTKNIALVLDKSGKLFVDGKPTELAQLPALISEMKATKEAQVSLQALISADEETPHGAVVQVMDVIRKNGVSDFAINVDSSK